ncbi:MAG: DNA repair protein RecO [Spirochaetaceae bacterium]
MKRQRRFSAIILATSRFGEIHRSVQLLTEEDEIVRAMAHGASAPKGKLRGKADQLTYGVCYLYTEPVKGYSKITDFDPVEFYPGIKGNLEALYTASSWAEAVLKSLAGGGQTTEVFGLLKESLDGLEAELPAGGRTPGGVGSALLARLYSIRFLWRYLGILGVQPDLGECGSCGRLLGGREPLFVRPRAGDIACAACATDYDLLLPAPDALARLAAAEVGAPGGRALESSSLSAEDSRQLSGVLYTLLEAALGASLETRRSGRSILGMG